MWNSKKTFQQTAFNLLTMQQTAPDLKLLPEEQGPPSLIAPLCEGAKSLMEGKSRPGLLRRRTHITRRSPGKVGGNGGGDEYKKKKKQKEKNAPVVCKSVWFLHLQPRLHTSSKTATKPSTREGKKMCRELHHEPGRKKEKRPHLYFIPQATFASKYLLSN